MTNEFEHDMGEEIIVTTNVTPTTPTASKPMPSSLPPDPMLLHILTSRRCHSSAGEINFRTSLLSWLKVQKVKHRVSEPGNIIVTIGKSTTMFSCHLDTVHTMNESNTKQELFFDPGFGHIFLADKKASTCLGADDGAGIWLMQNMIQKKIPGTYIFHVGEERGGIGSRALLAKEPEFIKTFDRAVAFDRAGDSEVIITQGGSLCASTDFGGALSTALNQHGLRYENSDKGTFTDTKIYAGLIPECVNIGVGYYNQHGPDEYLDVDHLRALLEALLKIKWEELEVVRKPVPYIQPQFPTYNRSLPKSSPRYGSPFRGMDFDEIPEIGTRNRQTSPPPQEAVLKEWQELLLMDGVEIEELCHDDPEIASTSIKQLIEEYEALRARYVMLKRLYPE